MQKEPTVQEQATVQVQLPGHITASCLIEALSADPVNTALKQTLKEQPAGAMHKRPAETSQQKEEAVAEEEQEEAGQRKEIFDMAVNRAMTLDISSDKVDTELPLMPLHTVRSCMFEQRKDILGIRMRGQEGAMRYLWTEVNITGPQWFAWSRLSSLRPVSHCIPYDLHGYVVPVLKGTSLYVVTGCSLLGSGTSIEVNMLRTCYWTHMKYKGPDDLGCDAEDEVWKYIQGIWTPGQRYAPGQRAVLIARPRADHWQVVFLGTLDCQARP